METQTHPLTYDNDFAEFLTRRDAGEVVEIDEEMFYYWLEVLPPKHSDHPSIRMNGGYGGTWTRPDGSTQRFSFLFAEGYELLTAFWVQGGRFFGQITNVLNNRD